jgi:hypothetical protein
LAERVRKLTACKRELEDRISALPNRFFKMAPIRSDIAGLFDKLSGCSSRVGESS